MGTINLSTLNCSNSHRSNSCFESNFYCLGHFLTHEEVVDLKSSWSRIIGEDTGGHGMNIFIMFFKSYPEIKVQYFGFLNSLNEEELRTSPRLLSHASGVLLGVTQIINGLENPLVVADVANKFAKSHFVRGVRETNVRLLMRMIIQYLQVETLKKNLTVMMIALFVFGIEKLIEFLTAIFSSPVSDDCACNSTQK